MIETPDPSGCARYDDMLYRSKEGIPDEAYVDFVARYCDFEDRIVRTKYAVACVYYGKKAVYQGAEAKLERNYNAIYAPLLVDSAGWTQDANGFFWRVVETVGREPLRPGDRVRRLERRCEHDEDGKETLAKDFVAVGDPRPLEADDVLFVVTKEPWNGMVIEVVGPAKHAFVRVSALSLGQRPPSGCSLKRETWQVPLEERGHFRTRPAIPIANSVEFRRFPPGDSTENHCVGIGTCTLIGETPHRTEFARDVEMRDGLPINAKAFGADRLSRAAHGVVENGYKPHGIKRSLLDRSGPSFDIASDEYRFLFRVGGRRTTEERVDAFRLQVGIPPIDRFC